MVRDTEQKKPLVRSTLYIQILWITSDTDTYYLCSRNCRLKLLKLWTKIMQDANFSALNFRRFQRLLCSLINKIMYILTFKKKWIKISLDCYIFAIISINKLKFLLPEFFLNICNWFFASFHLNMMQKYYSSKF